MDLEMFRMTREQFEWMIQATILFFGIERGYHYWNKSKKNNQ